MPLYSFDVVKKKSGMENSDAYNFMPEASIKGKYTFEESKCILFADVDEGYSITEFEEHTQTPYLR